MFRLNGSKLKALRESKNKTQAELAEAADTSERYIRDLESGRKSDPSAGIVYGFAHCLGVSMEELMTVSKEEA